MLIIIGIAVGAVLALAIDLYIPVWLTSYAAIVILASMDSIFGAYRSHLEKKFDLTIFITGLTGNSVIAVLLMFIGKHLGADLYLAAVLVFGMRMFQNFAAIRRYYLKLAVARKKKRLAEKEKEEENPSKQP